MATVTDVTALAVPPPRWQSGGAARGHDRGMTPALALALQLILAAEGSCYFVGNTQTLVLPSCDIGPATIAELTERSAPRAAASAPRRAGAPAARTAYVGVGGAMERRLEVAEQERTEAVARRLAAEAARDQALAQRSEALRSLAEARRALAEAEARLERAGRCAAPARQAD